MEKPKSFLIKSETNKSIKNDKTCNELEKVEIAVNKQVGTKEESKEVFDNKRINKRVKAEIEEIYYCGAMTRKGTPCMRQVKGGGRCWQHKGQPAMLKPEELLVTK